MNIHTTPQTVGTHNNTHQYINMAKRQLPIGQPFRVYTSHTYSRHRPHRNLPAVEGPRRGGSQTHVFPTWVEKTKPAEFLCGCGCQGVQRLCCFYIVSRNFSVCVVVLIYAAIPSSINHAPRCFACANLPDMIIGGATRGGGHESWAPIRMLKS